MSAKPNYRTLPSLLRLEQGYKAVVVWLPSIFYGHGAYLTYGYELVLLTLGWILLSQLIYLFNDLVDLPQDRLDANRRHRPLAAGTLAPRHAFAMMVLVALCLGGVMLRLDRAALAWYGAYAAMNVAYSLGLKKVIGVRQAIVAIGFWMRLQSGGAPGVPIPITAWAAIFALGLAYYLNTLKGFGKVAEDGGAARWAAAFGAMLSGSLALVALTALCLKRGSEGTLARPEFPPLLCLVGMHRFAYLSCFKEAVKEQAWAVFRDPVTLLAIGLFFVTLAVK